MSIPLPFQTGLALRMKFSPHSLLVTMDTRPFIFVLNRRWIIIFPASFNTTTLMASGSACSLFCDEIFQSRTHPEAAQRP